MRHEVRRGRKFIEYHDDEQPEGTFTQEISGADVSYQDEAGSWRQLVEDWESDGADGFSFRASRMNHKVRFDSIGAWRWYPRRNVETEYLVLNRPQCWLTATKRWGNLLVNGISREGKDITLTSVRNVTRVIHSRWNGIKTDWILLNANAPTRFRQKIDLVGITEIEGVLFGADGERLGQLTPTTATDSTFDEMGEPTQLPCTGSYVNGYVEFQADVTGAVYPVVIDPDFAGASDSVKINSAAGTDFSAARATSTTAARLGVAYGYLGVLYANPNYTCYRILHKFDTSSIGAASTVTQVNFTGTGVNVYISADYDYYLVKYDWSAFDADITNAANRETVWDALTTSDIETWCNRQNLAVNTPETSGNLDTDWINKTGITYYGLIQENDRTNTAIEANYLMRHCPPNYTTEAYRPVLTVLYTEAASGTLLRVNMNAQMQSLSGGFHG